MTDPSSTGSGTGAARVSRRAVLGATSTAAAAAGVVALTRSLAGAASSRPDTVAEATASPTALPEGWERVTVATWFVSLADNRLGPQVLPWSAVGGVAPAARRVAAAALAALLAGPDEAAREAELGTALPAGLEVISAELDEDEPAVVRVRLSEGLLAPPEAGIDDPLLDRLATPAAGQTDAPAARAIRLRLAQAVFTLTQFDTITGVLFDYDEETLGAISALGELAEGSPLTRDRFDDLWPLVCIERPLPLATVGPSFEVAGTSNTFESALSLRLTDADGGALLELPVTATSGNGVRGTFAETITVPEGTPPGRLTLRGFEYSARDGSEVSVHEVPVDYDPGG